VLSTEGFKVLNGTLIEVPPEALTDTLQVVKCVLYFCIFSWDVEFDICALNSSFEAGFAMKMFSISNLFFWSLTCQV